MPADQWALEVVDRSGVVVAALEPASFSVTMRLNAPGELRGAILADDAGAAQLEVFSRVVRAYRRAGNVSPSVARTLRFAGHVHDLEDTGDAHGLEVTSFLCRDPAAMLEGRHQPWSSSWGPNTLAVAVAGFIGDLNISAEDPAGLDATYPHGLTVTALGAGWPTSTWAFTKHQPAVEAFRGLQEGEAGVQGFYWTVKPVASGTTHGSMNIAVALADLSAIAEPIAPLEYGPGTKANLASYRAQRIPPVNSVIAVSGGLTWKNDSETSGATYGLWTSLVSYQDVDTTAKLDALARGVWQVWPADSIAVELAHPADPDAAYQAPMLWDTFDIGDRIPIYIRGARRSIAGLALVREATVEVDANGEERLTGLVLELEGTS